MKVLIIPEDFRNDQYVLQPIAEAMLRHAGKSQVTVRVLTDPLLGGVDQATRWDRIEPIISRYKGMVDVIVLCVDRDGDENRKAALDALEKRANPLMPAGKRFLAENAWQEIEVWLLAGHDLPAGWDWKQIRAEINPKETYFMPFARSRRLLDEPGEGRRTLGREAAKRYDRIRALCPEDVAALEDRIGRWIGGER